MSDDRRLPEFGVTDRQIWVAALVLYGFGDVVTTFWGLSTVGVTEFGPIVGHYMKLYGRYTLLPVKVVVITSFYLVWRHLRTPGRVAVPFALILTGVAVTIWNILIIVRSM